MQELSDNASLAQAERYLEQARQALSLGRADLLAEEWALLAHLVSSAHDLLIQARRDDPQVELPLFDEVMEEFRDLTADFTDPQFLRATRAARRTKPDLFQAR